MDGLGHMSDASPPDETLAACRLTLTEQAIRLYAAITEDANPIHLDRAFAAATSLGVPIAHGTLVLNALWAALAETLLPEGFAGTLVDLRFLKPVPVGETVTASLRRGAEAEADWVLGIRDSSGRLVVEGRLTPRPP
jgi:3-hydroxybutyryl-CoA dehydratase